ncbi:hypothetical protein RF11_02771 [Thelohanellus kitauei]|uniref:Uncharacterized protein n=1 Tax=Thelohanellus kitauei TaxID=669202 RepID=A0A0C2MDX4_THEKT|nr:hypothetical protein RF11_02771 [Thelohanellus kitauei]
MLLFDLFYNEAKPASENKKPVHDICIETGYALKNEEFCKSPKDAVSRTKFLVNHKDRKPSQIIQSVLSTIVSPTEMHIPSKAAIEIIDFIRPTESKLNQTL